MIGQLQAGGVPRLGRRLADEYVGRREINRLTNESFPAARPGQRPVGVVPTGELAYLDLQRWTSDGAAGMNTAVVGVPGAGKSTALYRAMVECCDQGVPGVFVALKGEAPEGIPKVRLSDLVSVPLLSALPEGYERLNEKLVTDFLLEALDVTEQWPHGALISVAVRENVSGRAPSERSVRSVLDFLFRQGRDEHASMAHQQAARECRDRLDYLMDLPETGQLFRNGPGHLWGGSLAGQVSAIEFDNLQYPIAALCEGGPGGVVNKGGADSLPVSEGERVCLAALPLLVAGCYSFALHKRDGYAATSRASGSVARPQVVLAIDDAGLLMKARGGFATAEAILADSRKQGTSVWMSALRWRSLERLLSYLPNRLIGAPGEVHPSAPDYESLLALFAAGVRPRTPVLRRLASLRPGEFIYSSHRPSHEGKRGIIRFFDAVEPRLADGGDHSAEPDNAFTGASDAAQ